MASRPGGAPGGGGVGGGGGSLKVKVVLLGEGRVGKTSLVLRYVENKFNDKHYQTLQVRLCNLKYPRQYNHKDSLYFKHHAFYHFFVSMQASFLEKKLNISGKRITLNIWVSTEIVCSSTYKFSDNSYDQERSGLKCGFHTHKHYIN